MKKKMTTQQNTLRPPGQSMIPSALAMTVIKTRLKMSHVMRESAFGVCENKGPSQLSGSRTVVWLLNGCRVNNNFMYIHPAAMYIAELALEWLPCK